MPPQPEKQEEAAPPPPSQGPLSQQFVFRGYYSLGGEWHFSIFDNRAQRAIWVTLNQPDSPLQVYAFNPESETIEFGFNGQRESLALPAPSANAAVPAPAGPVLAPQTLSSGVPAAAPGGPNRPVLRRPIIPRRVIPAPSGQPSPGPAAPAGQSGQATPAKP